MKPGQCATGVSVDDLSPHDQAEVGKFAVYLHQVGQAQAAGLLAKEAHRTIYSDAYPNDAEAASKAVGR